MCIHCNIEEIEFWQKKSWLATACKPARLFLTLRQLSTDSIDGGGGGDNSGGRWSMSAQNSGCILYRAGSSHMDNSRSCTDSNRIGIPDSQIRLQLPQRQ